MPLFRKARSFLRNLIFAGRAEEDLDQEVRSHLQMLIDENLRAGLGREEAERAARLELGGTEQVKEQVREKRLGSGLHSVSSDCRFGLRQLRKNPGFTLTVVFTLALSVGANTAIFSLVNALLLKSLPYQHPERMGTIFMRIQGAKADVEPHWIDGAQWEALRDNMPSLIAAVSNAGASGVNLMAGEHVEYVHQGRISAHYLDVLAVHPLLGRNFSEAEDQPHGPNAAILSYALWRNTFGGERDLVGRTIHLKGEPYTVVGVLSEGVRTPLNADLYTAIQPRRDGEGSGTNYLSVARLRDGASWQQANAELGRAWADRIASVERRNPGSRYSYYFVPLQEGQTSELRPKALALMVAAGFILLIACANLAGLAVVQMVRRSPDVATRLALGASRWQVQKQFWVESLLLGIAGGAAGVGVGFAALRGLLSLLPKDYLPVASVPLDLRVLGFTLGVSVVTAILFGELPALAVRRVDLRSSIGSRGVAGGERLRLRQVLIALEVALTVVLLAGSGLLIRTLIHLQTLPPGFNPNGVMAAKASLDDARYHDPAKFQQLLTASVAAMRQIPGVRNAAMGLSLPFERVLND